MESQPLFSVVGDSISTFEGYVPKENRVYYEAPQTEQTGVLNVEDTWWMQVISHFGGTLYSNNSFSGSMVAGPAFPAGNSAERVCQLKRTRHEDGIKEAVGTGEKKPEKILIFMGLNDYGWGNAHNQMAARSAAMPQCAEALEVPEGEAGPASEKDAELFRQAYEGMLNRLKTEFPDATIFCITIPPGRVTGSEMPTFTYALRGVPLKDYNRAIIQAASSAGCQVVDVTMAGYDYEAIDGSHPTKRGMKQFASLVINAMDGTPLPAHLFDDTMRSQRLCTKSSCIGCDYARGTGNTWSCVCEKDFA